MENKKPNVRKAVQKAYEKAIIHRCKVNGEPNPLSGDSSSEDWVCLVAKTEHLHFLQLQRLGFSSCPSSENWTPLATPALKTEYGAAADSAFRGDVVFGLTSGRSVGVLFCLWTW